MPAHRGPVVAALSAVATLLAVLIGAPPAAAHTSLRGSVPAANATVVRPIDAVTLTFSQAVKRQFTTVVVSVGGVAFSAGPPSVSDRRVVQKVRPLPAGKVTVAWRSVALDGDPVQGVFAFTVAPSAGARPATSVPSTQDGEPGRSAASGSPVPPSPSVSAAPETVPTASGSSWGGTGVWLALAGAAAVLVLVAALVVPRVRRARRPPA